MGSVPDLHPMEMPACTEHCTGADALQLTLRFSFRARLTASVSQT
jgi:hypothetical protein